MRTPSILLSLLLGGLLAGCNGSSTHQAEAPAADGHVHETGEPPHGSEHASMKSMQKLEGLSGKGFDAAFASQMIEHHQGAVEMSETALKSAKRKEVKDAARKIIADQKREIAQMTGWVKEWTGNEPASEDRDLMKADMQPMMTAFNEESATDADRAFLTHMKVHHQMAVDMAKMAAEKAQHPELKELAGQVIAAQTKEIAQFDGLLKQWYP